MSNTKSELAVAYQNNKDTKKEEANMKAPAQKQTVNTTNVEEVFEKKQAKPTVNIPSLKQDAVKDNSKWYLSREDDLAVVNDESSNKDLGVENIRVFAPREDQQDYNVVMNISLQLSLGVEIRDINVRIREDGTLNLNFPFRMSKGENGQNRYYDSVRLGRQITAQVLSFAHNCIDWDSFQ